jgi:hypothetical protein
MINVLQRQTAVGGAPLYLCRMQLLPKKRKLLILALDQAAQAGEAENAAIAFMRFAEGPLW